MLLLLLLLLPPLRAGSLAQNGQYRLMVDESVTVQEGLCVFVPCSFSGPWSWNSRAHNYGYWFQKRANEFKDAAVATNNPHHKVQEGTQGRFHLLGHPRNSNCSLDIRDARSTDDGLYFFRVEGKSSYLYSYRQSMISVHVTALNHTPDILVPGTLESDRPSNLTCSVNWACERGTPPIFSWTSAAPTSLGPRTRLSSMLILTPRPQDHGTNLTCQVKFPAVGVTVERTIQLNITWELRTRSAVLQGAVGGAGVTALLAGCLCLIYFLVKTRRKKAARKAVVIMNSSRPAIGSASLSSWYMGHQPKPNLERAADSTSSARNTPIMGLEPEPYYASIRFPGMNSLGKSTHMT